MNSHSDAPGQSIRWAGWHLRVYQTPALPDTKNPRNASASVANTA
jgi:hypothetical protein